MVNRGYLFLAVMLISISFISSSLTIPYNDDELPKVILNIPEEVSSTTNYSLVNVNNSQFLQGYTPATLKTFFQITYDTLYSGIQWNYNQTLATYNNYDLAGILRNDTIANLTSLKITTNLSVSGNFFVNNTHFILGPGTPGTGISYLISAPQAQLEFKSTMSGGGDWIWYSSVTGDTIGAGYFTMRKYGLATAASHFIINPNSNAIIMQYGAEIAGTSGWFNASNFLFANKTNVGIGTSKPTHTLNVVGNSNFTGNLTANVYHNNIDWVYTIIGMSGNTACDNLDNKISGYAYTCQTCIDTAGATQTCATTLVTLNANCACRID